MTPGRLLGVDYGDRRVGVALSDPTGSIASPLTVLPTPEAVAGLARLAAEHRAAAVIVGLPLKLDGSDSPATAKARAFADRLRAALKNVPVDLWDERFSTVTAEQALIEGGVRRERRKALVDGLAAQILLQHYLDARAPAPDPDGEDFP